MKKRYINPNMEVVKIATHQMLASSVNATLSGTASNEDALGREFDLDFDDED